MSPPAEELGEPTIHFDSPDATPGEEIPSRGTMVRDIAVFQGKLFVDGLRDGMLMPITLAAGLLGIVSKNKKATAVFYDVLRLGMRTERWINLFQPVAKHEVQNLLNGIGRIRRTLAVRSQLDDQLADELDRLEESIKALGGVEIPQSK